MLIMNGTIITYGADGYTIYPDDALYIDGDTIREIGPSRALLDQYPDAEPIDARGQLVMPGNICAHTHFYGAYARGMAIPGDPPADFPAVLRQLWWPLDKALDEDTVRLSALVSLVDAIKHGTTTLIDHHASPNFIDGSLDVIADAVTQAGLCAVLCYEVTDRDGPEKAEAGIAENVRARSKYSDHSLVRATFGLHASMTLSDATLRACADANPTGGFHIHVAEHEADQIDSERNYGKRVVGRLHDFGMLHDRTLLAHCVHIDESERALLREHQPWVTHQPRSNMNNGVGAMAFDTMLAEHIRVCLGNDGFTNNMWAEWKEAYLLHKVANRDPRRANGADVARAAAGNNARLAQHFFGRQVGEIVVGGAADLILVDYHPFTPLTGGNLPWHIIFGVEPSMVTTTIVNGRVLLRDRQLLTLDEAAITAEARAHAPRVWEQYMKNAEAALTT